MGFFSKISGLLSETPLGTLADRAIDRFLPEKLSEAEREELKREIAKDMREHELKLLAIGQQTEAEFNDRVKAMEGTAADLKTIPVLGSLVIFLRGTQRPMWGFATLFFDWQWFTASWENMTDRQEVALLVINILVLGFLFGERAMKNVMPLIAGYLKKKVN